MHRTPTNLYRMGNAVSSRMDNIRSKDIEIYEEGRELWVAANSGGISTFSVLGYGRNWWQLDAGFAIPSELRVVNDHGNHWLWEPAYSMPLEIYVIALKIVGNQFYKLN
jgi:hypothetical protein